MRDGVRLENLYAVAAIPSGVSGKGVDVGALLDRAFKADAVAKAIPWLGTDKGGVLSVRWMVAAVIW